MRIAVAGLAVRLAGVDVVIDTSNHNSHERAVAEAFFGGVTRTLLSAEAETGVAHHVALSIVGIEDVDSGYDAGKRLQERLLAEGDVPWSVLRATQFHEFVEQALHFVTVGPFSLVPRMLSQPVGRAPDLAGPDRLQMVDLARRVSRARGLGRRVVPVRLPGAAGKAMRSGALIPTGDGPRGRVTFDEWLAAG